MSRQELISGSPLQQLMMEQAKALAIQLERTGNLAPEGEVLDQLESVVMNQGREFLRQSLENATQCQVEAVEKKLRPAAIARAAGGDATKDETNARC